ncbi:MAG: homocysteine S-methyltransferase family protein [Verrucomicrobiota bacterium]
MKNNLLSELQIRQLLCDGAMGTQLLAAGLASGECSVAWNIDRPDIVRDVHHAYVLAGCSLVTTNTFSGTTSVLAGHGLAERMAELNRAGAQLARAAAGDSAWVLGDVGPFGDFLKPLGEMTPAELRCIFRAQIEALIEGGADAILAETMCDPAEVEVGITAAKDVGPIPVVASYTFQKAGPTEFRTMMGTTVEEAMKRAINAGADIVGTNCGTALTLADYVELARQLVAAAGQTPVIVQPNAGAPQVIDGQTVYLATPDEMGAVVPQLLKAGVRIVGGCCGTSPAILTAMSSVLRREIVGG